MWKVGTALITTPSQLVYTWGNYVVSIRRTIDTPFCSHEITVKSYKSCHN